MIFISAGHYPQKPGAGFGDFYEWDEAMQWAKLIHESVGDGVVLVPTGILKQKIEFINNRINGNSIAMEIHFNSAKNKDGEHVGRGCETLYYPGSHKGIVFAQLVNDAMAENIIPNRGIKEGYYRMNPDNGPDFFLARTKCPAIIIEPDFIHRKEIIQRLRNIVCDAIALALIETMEVLS